MISAADLQQVGLDGYTLSVWQAGEGAPVVVIHGSLSDCRSWAQQMPAFSPHYKTLAPSLRHCWPERWDGKGADFNAAQHADDIAALIGEVGGSAHVVGHSRGGAVSLQLALRYPHLIRALVLADPGGLEGLLPDTEEGRAMAGESSRMFGALKDELARGDTLIAARAFAESLGGAGAWERRPPEQQQVLLDNITTGPACAERPTFTREELSALASPMLLVTGERSPRRYPLMLAEFARCNANVKGFVTVPDAAHAMHRDNPMAFNAAVLGFLATQGAD